MDQFLFHWYFLSKILSACFEASWLSIKFNHRCIRKNLYFCSWSLVAIEIEKCIEKRLLIFKKWKNVWSLKVEGGAFKKLEDCLASTNPRVINKRATIANPDLKRRRIKEAVTHSTGPSTLSFLLSLCPKTLASLPRPQGQPFYDSKSGLSLSSFYISSSSSKSSVFHYFFLSTSSLVFQFSHHIFLWSYNKDWYLGKFRGFLGWLACHWTALGLVD